jgi:hypothetical protein
MLLPSLFSLTFHTTNYIATTDPSLQRLLQSSENSWRIVEKDSILLVLSALYGKCPSSSIIIFPG